MQYKYNDQAPAKILEKNMIKLDLSQKIIFKIVNGKQLLL